MDLKEQLKSLSAQDRKELLKQLQQEEKESKRNRRDAYEGLRAPVSYTHLSANGSTARVSNLCGTMPFMGK